MRATQPWHALCPTQPWHGLCTTQPWHGLRAAQLWYALGGTQPWRDQDRIVGLDAGADDYIVKPFAPKVRENE